MNTPSRTATLLGNGVTLSQLTTSGGTATAIGGVTAINAGGYSTEFVDDTDLSNLACMTKVSGGLKEYNDITFTIKVLAASTVAAGKSQWTVTFGTHGSMSFFGELAGRGDLSIEPKTAITAEITVTPPNLDWTGAESEPTLSLS